MALFLRLLGGTLVRVEGEPDDSDGLDTAQRARRLRRRLEEMALELFELERLAARKRQVQAEAARSLLLSFRAERHRQDAEAYEVRANALRFQMDRVRGALVELEDGA